ncbi:MAG: hypothetical protein U0271_03725 [Polyangiaceae bacterium]
MKRARRPLAYSVVTTISITAACSPSPGSQEPTAESTASASATAEPSTTTSTSASTSASASASTTIATVDPTTKTSASQSASVTPPPERRVVGSIRQQGAKCQFVETAEPCPPNTKCNPPAPRYVDVPCPSVTMPLSIVMVASGGKCHYSEPRSGGKCPPGASCNPPPPKRIEVPCDL